MRNQTGRTGDNIAIVVLCAEILLCFDYIQNAGVAPITYSTDLHSVGQFIQQGSPIIAETFIKIVEKLENSGYKI